MTNQRVLAALKRRGGEWVSAKELAEELFMHRSSILYHAHILAEAGEPVEFSKRHGVRLAIGDVGPTSPAPEPSQEQPAKEAAKAASSLPAAPPPAGLSALPDAHDLELRVIGEIVHRIESLTGHETRARVAAYIAARFGC